MGIQPAHDPASHVLAGQLLEIIAAWEAKQGASLEPTERNWRIAEALHILTWERPHTHAPLTLLFDEERMSAQAANRPSVSATCGPLG